jgi:hypothetical protein
MQSQEWGQAPITPLDLEKIWISKCESFFILGGSLAAILGKKYSFKY